MNKTEVFIRQLNKMKTVKYTSNFKPRVSEDIQNKWQMILNVLADLLNVPAGLIMKINKRNMEVFIKSNNKENPYPVNGKDDLGNGLYCETVIGEDKALEVENALKSDVWNDNPDVKINMISYYGLPLKWKNGEIFGTICVLDNKEHNFTKKHKTLLELFKNAIEIDLYNLELIKDLNSLARTDYLTRIGNRKYIFELLDEMFDEFKNSKKEFCVVMLDIDHFKKINDYYGHQIGDQILKLFSETIKNELDINDKIGRVGGDELLSIFKDKDIEIVEKEIVKIKSKLIKSKNLKKYNISFSYGIGKICSNINSLTDLIREADHKLMKQKQKL